MNLAFTSCVLLAAVLVTGIDAFKTYANLSPNNLIFCGGQRTLRRELSCHMYWHYFSDKPNTINITAYMGTEIIGRHLSLRLSYGLEFRKEFLLNDISPNNTSPITFICAGESNEDQKNISTDVPIIYPPEEPPYLMINGKVIQGPEVKIPHETFNAKCSVNGGLPSTNLTLTCPGHGSESGNNSVQMRVEEAATGTQCTCHGAHPSGCYEKNSTEVTFIVPPHSGFVQPWPVELGKPLLVNCTLDNIIGGIQNLSEIDPLEFIFRVTLEVADGETYASLYDPKLNRTDLDQPFQERGEFTKGFSFRNFKMGGDAMNGNHTQNAGRIFVAMEIEEAQCPHVTDYTCVFEYFTNYSERSSEIKRFSKTTKKFDAKTNINPKPLMLGQPMTVTCSDSANNDDLNVTVVNIQLFIKHEESFKRLFTYNTDESTANSKIDTDGFQLEKSKFNASLYTTDGKPRHFLTMEVSHAHIEHIMSIYKCQFQVTWPNSCTKTEEFLSIENERADCSDDVCGIHNCEVKEGVATCLCLPGYVNSGPLHCHDIDECKHHHDICLNNTCVNTNGSYRCECHHGNKHIDPKLCVHVNLFEPARLRQQNSALFQLKSIEAKVISLGFCYMTIGFFITTAILFANSVWESIHRFVTTEPVDGIVVKSTLCHYMYITKYVEVINDQMKDKVASEGYKSIQPSVLSAQENDSICPTESDIPLNNISGSGHRGSVYPERDESSFINVYSFL